MHVCTNGKSRFHFSRFYFCFCFQFCEFNKLNVLLPERNPTERSEANGKNLDEFPKICWDTPVRHTHTYTHTLVFTANAINYNF